MQQSVSKARHCSAGHKSATKPSSPPQSGRTYHPLSLPAGASDCREYALGKIRAIQGAVLTWINIPGSAPTLPISLVLRDAIDAVVRGDGFGSGPNDDETGVTTQSATVVTKISRATSRDILYSSARPV